jgi:hypothetical protein
LAVLDDDVVVSVDELVLELGAEDEVDDVSLLVVPLAPSVEVPLAPMEDVLLEGLVEL